MRPEQELDQDQELGSGFVNQIGSGHGLGPGQEFGDQIKVEKEFDGLDLQG